MSAALAIILAAGMAFAIWLGILWGDNDPESWA